MKTLIQVAFIKQSDDLIAKLVAWVEKRPELKVGSLVELKDKNGMWEVAALYTECTMDEIENIQDAQRELAWKLN